MVNKKINSPEKNKTSLRAKQRFSNSAFFVLVFIVFAIADLIYYYDYKSSSLSEAMQNSQVVLVEMATRNIVAGKLYKEAAEVKSKNVDSAVTKDPKVTSSQVSPVQQTNSSVQNQNVLEQTNIKQKAKIALIIIDLGLDRQLTLNALEMPNSITLGFTPYASSVEEWINYSVSRGFETLINIPMQPNNPPSSNPGSYALLNTLTIEENLNRLEAILSKAGKAVGIYSHPHESFSKFASNMVPLLSQLAKRDMFYIYGNAANERSIKSLSEYFKIKLKSVSSKIDEELTPDAIRNNLSKLEAAANANGYAVGLVSPYNVTLDEVKKWIKGIDGEKLMIVPVSQLFDNNKQNVQVSK